MAVNLPDHVSPGDSGHVEDTNLLIEAVALLDAVKIETLAIGTVETGAAGEPAAATIVAGPGGTHTLSLTLPAGEPGPASTVPGPPGPTGPTGGLDQATADARYVNVTGDTITSSTLTESGLIVQRTVPATSVNDADIFTVNYLGTRGTWANEKGNLRTSNEGSKGEVAFKIIAASQAEGGVGDLFQILDIAGNVQTRVGPLGRQNFNKGVRLVGDNIQIRDSTEVDESTISQPLGGDLTITPKKGLTSTKKITGPASTTAQATVNIPHGAAPTTPVNGDMWTTSAGLFIRINGVTKQVTLT